MRCLIAACFLLCLLSSTIAEPLQGEWRAELSGSTLETEDYISGSNTTIHHDGKVYNSSWSSGVAGPTQTLVGKADPATLKKLRIALSELNQKKANNPGDQGSLFLQHGGKAFAWRWGKQGPTGSVKKAVAAFQAAVKSAK